MTCLGKNPLLIALFAACMKYESWWHDGVVTMIIYQNLHGVFIREMAIQVIFLLHWMVIASNLKSCGAKRCCKHCGCLMMLHTEQAYRRIKNSHNFEKRFSCKMAYRFGPLLETISVMTYLHKLKLEVCNTFDRCTQSFTMYVFLTSQRTYPSLLIRSFVKERGSWVPVKIQRKNSYFSIRTSLSPWMLQKIWFKMLM